MKSTEIFRLRKLEKTVDGAKCTNIAINVDKLEAHLVVSWPMYHAYPDEDWTQKFETIEELRHFWRNRINSGYFRVKSTWANE